ncbi:MAG TPA: septal ring lytic transglycosylase RlpA family protein [Candidatus Peribacterales bacterium]|nr:septal ring lytic transglycosylase RlpA family protein [Candidatus Peribacterales bacterium]
MQRSLILIFAAVLSLQSAYAEEVPSQSSISRAEGLRIMWEPLKRPVEETSERPFTDIPESHPDFALITFAKARGMVEDGTLFYPDEPLRLTTALLWLLQTRNTDSWANIRYDTLSKYAEKYTLLESPTALEENPSLSGEELRTLMETLDMALRNERHTVSYYSDDFAGDNTAFGELFDPNALTAAHRTLPHNTLVNVTNEENGKSVTVRINDRGPFIEGRDMDLSRTAFQRISSIDHGVISNITFERLGSATETVEGSLCGDSYFQRRVGDTLLTPGIPAIIAKGTTLEITGDRAFRALLLRIPGARAKRSDDWKESLTLSFEKVGTATIVLHTESGRKRRFKVNVTEGCS